MLGSRRIPRQALGALCLALGLCGPGAVSSAAGEGESLRLRGVAPGMTEAEARATLRDFRFECAPVVKPAQARYEGRRCRYEEERFALSFTVSPESERIYRVRTVETYGPAASLETIDARLTARHGLPGHSELSAYYDGIHHRTWGDCRDEPSSADALCLRATIRIGGVAEVTLHLADPEIAQDAAARRWFRRYETAE